MPGTEIPEALQRTGAFCGGIRRDYSNRLPHTISDFTDGLSAKTLSAALFMFCATFASTVALGDVAFRETDGKVGITEYLMLQGISGILHSLFSACPLPILRPTGPITAFMIDLYQLSSWVGVGYYALLSWVGFWVGLFLILIAVFDLSVYISLCTRFLHDIYAVFVCTIYISDGIIGVQQRFQKVRPPPLCGFFPSMPTPLLHEPIGSSAHPSGFLRLVQSRIYYVAHHSTTAAAMCLGLGPIVAPHRAG
jgi:hypothetical protein